MYAAQTWTEKEGSSFTHILPYLLVSSSWQKLDIFNAAMRSTKPSVALRLLHYPNNNSLLWPNIACLVKNKYFCLEFPPLLLCCKITNWVNHWNAYLMKGFPQNATHSYTHVTFYYWLCLAILTPLSLLWRRSKLYFRKDYEYRKSGVLLSGSFLYMMAKNSFVSCFQFPASHLPHIPSSKLLPSNPLIFNRHFQEHNSTQQPAASPSGKLPPSTSTCSTPYKCSSMPRSVSLLQAVPRLKATGRWIAQPEVTQ